MKKIVLIVMCSSLLLATNGDNLIGLGVKSRAMGGIGIATYFGAENMLSNPAMITKTKKTEVDIGVTLFKPTVKANGIKSDSDVSIMPELFSSTRLNENWAFGIGMFGTAGMGVNYQENPTLMDAKTSLMLMKFAPTLSYHSNDFAIGFAPIIQYGSLDIEYNMHNFNGSGIYEVGKGASDDFGFGFAIGTSYDINEDITIGLVYKSKIDMNYNQSLSVASQPFVGFGIFHEAFTDDLAQPAEYGAGISYNINNFNFSFDYKKIMWGEAKGYKDFGWNNQDVYALGTKYEKDGTWVSLGYNHAKNPITIQDGTTNLGAALNMFNYLMFPATSQDHFTIGTGTMITKNLSTDLAIVYSPNSTFNVNTTIGALKVEHQETSISLSMRYYF